MGKKTEESLIDALSYCDLRDLPDVEDGENVWIRAIAKIVKSDGLEYYAYVEKGQNLENRIIKDFGSMSSIVKVSAYYPFSYLKADYMPEFKTKKKEERIAYLTRFKVNKDYSNMTLKELNDEVLKGAIEMQLAKEKRNSKNTESYE